MERHVDSRATSRAFLVASVGLLALAFLTGGSAQIHGWDDSAVQLLSLPVLGWALWRFADLWTDLHPRIALVLMATLVLVPVVQLLPLPPALWHWPEARQQLASDLAMVGVEPRLRWSLAPSHTLDAVLFLLPPLAIFAATVSLPRRSHPRLLWAVLVLAMGSLGLAFAQLGVPAENALNPFPRWAHQFNGVFANQNHQAISMVVAIVIALGGLVAAVRSRGEGRRRVWIQWVLGFCALFALLALPLTGSRGALLIMVFVVAAVPWGMGLLDRHRLRRARLTRVALIASLGLVALGAWGAAGWMQADSVDELRAPMRAATWQLGLLHAPWGTGMGAFVPAFAQSGHDALLLRVYVNHAHNEYVQWWMEAGWLAVAAGALILVVLGACARRALSTSQDRFVPVVSLLGLLALFVHSWVDYPLRTTSLAVVAAVLAGILVSRAGAPRTPRVVGESGGRASY